MIKNKDLHLFSRLIAICEPFNLNNGTVTAFANYCLISPFIPPQDQRFEHYIRSIGEYIKQYYNQEDNSTKSFYEKISNSEQKSRQILAYNPFVKLESHNISFDGMSSTIELACSILNIFDEADYYKDPSILFYKIEENNEVENYINNIAFPTLLKYLSTFDLDNKIQQAIADKKDLDIEFYPEKLKNLFDSYLYYNHKDEYSQLIEEILKIS